MQNGNPIIIVGMARSGTTLVSHIFGNLPNVHIEVEPHALWKSGNFKYLNDEEFDINDRIIKNIRNKFTKGLNGRLLVEKSPINCLRPALVHAVFPEARIVYVERDPVRCIYSNYVRSVNNDSFKLSIILKKYFRQTGSEDLAGATSERKLFQQIELSDIPQFLTYTSKMFYYRQIKKMLPFGPKLKDFFKIVEEKGLLAYHVEAYKAAVKYKSVYSELFKNRFETFKMETIMHGETETSRMLEFADIKVSKDWLSNIQNTLDKQRIYEAVKERPVDKEILALL